MCEGCRHPVIPVSEAGSARNATHLQEVRAKEPRRLFQMPRVVHLTEVILLGPVGIPHLHEERFVEIEEFVAVEIGECVGFVRVEVLVWDPIWEVSFRSCAASKSPCVRPFQVLQGNNRE